MNIEKELEILSNLLKIELKDKRKYIEHIQKMLDFFKTLDEIDLKNYKPFIHSGFHKLYLRKDEGIEFKEKERIIENFPEKIERFLRAFSPIKEFKKK
ncbi:MAG: Asp-tRNA(Asn)/Glu-tRNA(Gln) amidotransferase subunit GatC [candidate division WOR-3 bacterium]